VTCTSIACAAKWRHHAAAGVITRQLSPAQPEPKPRQRRECWLTVSKTVRRMLSDRCLSCLSVCPVCDVGVFWPNGWMDQDEPWHAGRPRPWPRCVRWDPAPLPQKGAEPPIFDPYLLWINGWMDQDNTWQRARPQPRQDFVRWGPSSSPPKGADPQFSAHAYCGQTAVWIKMNLGTEVGLGPGHIVLDGASSLSPKGGGAPNFRRISVVAKWLGGSRCRLVRR